MLEQPWTSTPVIGRREIFGSNACVCMVGVCLPTSRSASSEALSGDLSIRQTDMRSCISSGSLSRGDCAGREEGWHCVVMGVDIVDGGTSEAAWSSLRAAFEISFIDGRND